MQMHGEERRAYAKYLEKQKEEALEQDPKEGIPFIGAETGRGGESEARGTGR